MAATYPKSGSPITDGVINTGLSTQISIRVDKEAVGAIQTLTIRQTRSLFRVLEVGLDGILEITPNKAAEHECTVKRIVFDRKRLPQAFTGRFVNIKSQFKAFNIDITDNTEGPGSGAYIHTLENCWFTNYSPTYQADNFIISEDATIWFEDIKTYNAATGAPITSDSAITDERNTWYNVERLTDRGSYRGTLDVIDIDRLMTEAFSEE